MNEKLNFIIKEIQKIYPNIKLTGSYSHNLLGVHKRIPNDLDFVISKEDFLKKFKNFKDKISNLQKYTENYETEELEIIEIDSFEDIVHITFKFQNQQICIFFEELIESEQFRDLIEVVNPEISFNKKYEYVKDLESKSELTQYQNDSLQKHKIDICEYEFWKSYTFENSMNKTLKQLIKLEPNLILHENYSHFLLGILENFNEQKLEFYLSFEDFKKIQKNLEKKSTKFFLKYNPTQYNLNKYISKKINYIKTYGDYNYINSDDGIYELISSNDDEAIEFECVINSIKVKIHFNSTIDFDIYDFEDFKIKIYNSEITFIKKQIEYLQEEINFLKTNESNKKLELLKKEISQYNSWKFFKTIKL